MIRLAKHKGNNLNGEFHLLPLKINNYKHMKIKKTTSAFLFLSMLVLSNLGFAQVTLQNLKSEYLRNPIGIDGQFGQETGDAARDLLMSLGLGTASKLGTTKEIERCLNRNWITFLDTAAESAFQFLKGQRAEVPSPAELLHDVYKTIQAELGQSQGRKTIETTLTAFAEHPETVAWLAQWDQTD